MSENNDKIEEDQLEAVVENGTQNPTHLREESKEERIAQLQYELQKEREKVAAHERKIQYLLADFENLKKRAELDVQNRVDAITNNIILKFLSIYDDFIRARDALSKQKAKTEGLDGILKNMDSFLFELGIKPIEVLGEIFDPKFHEAISQQPSDEHPPHTVILVAQDGFTLHDRVVRPVQVIVSTAPVRSEQ